MFLKYLLYFFLYFSGPAERGSSTRNTLTEHNEETNKDDSEEDDLSPSAVHHVTAGLQGGDSGPELEVYSASTVVPPPVWPPRSQSARSNSSGSGSSTSAKLDQTKRFDAEPTFTMRLTQISRAQANFFDSLPRPPAANSPASLRSHPPAGGSTRSHSRQPLGRDGSGRSRLSEPSGGQPARRRAAVRHQEGGLKRLGKGLGVAAANLTQNSAYVNNIFLCQEMGWAGPPRRQESQQRQPPANHCFNIRHQPLLPALGAAGQAAEDEAERSHDSIVTTSLLQLTSFAASSATSSSSTNDGKNGKPPRTRPRRVAKVGLEKVEESPRNSRKVSKKASLSSASTASTATTTTTATSTATASRRPAGSSGNRKTRRNHIRAGTLRSQGGGEKRQKMRSLWEQTGMKTNGRKLLLDSEEDDEDVESGGGHANAAFESNDDDEDDDDDSSLVSLPQKPYHRYGRRRRHHSGSSSTMTATSYDSERSSQTRRPSKASTTAKRQPMTDTDAGQTKQVRFIRGGDEIRRSGTNSNRLLYDKVPPTVWVGSRKIYESYYGTTALGGVGGFKNPAAVVGGGGGSYPRLLSSASPNGSLAGSGFTLVDGGGILLKRRQQRRRRVKTCCKALCLFLLLATFLLVIVAVSIFLTKGKNHFGSM